MPGVLSKENEALREKLLQCKDHDRQSQALTMPFLAAEPLRLFRRDLVELVVAVELDAPLPLEQIHHIIRCSVVSDSELEALAMSVGHRFLDTEPTIGCARISVTAEHRHARVEIGRDGSVITDASMRNVRLISPGNPVPNLRRLTVEWRYRKAAGISFRPAWVAVQKLVLSAASEPPQEMADLVIAEVEDVAFVRVTVAHELLRSVDGVFIPAGQIDRKIASSVRNMPGSPVRSVNS